MQMWLECAHVVVVGGTSGIGFEVARKAAAAGELRFGRVVDTEMAAVKSLMDDRFWGPTT